MSIPLTPPADLNADLSALPPKRRANYCTENRNWFEFGPKPIVSSIASHDTGETDARKSATKSPVVG